MKKIITILLSVITISVYGQWTTQNPLLTGNGLNDVQFVNQNIGWVVGNAGTILFTANGGQNWNVTESGTDKDLLSLDFINENEGWIQGKGIILHTLDGGESWQKQIDCSATGMSSVCFTDPDNGWAEGIYKGFVTWGGTGVFFETIMHTTNGGYTWQPLDRVGDKIVSLCFIDPNHGWVASNWFYFDDIGSWSGGDISFTSDGGETLIEQNEGETINSLFFLDTLNGWAVGSSELVYTTDGGLNWITIGNIQGKDVFFADQENGWIAGNDGSILHSSDGGQSWNEQNSGTGAYLSAVWFNDPENGWAVGELGTILKTNNGGTDWYLYNTPTFYDNLYSVFVFDENNCLAAGYGYDSRKSVIARTENGGNDWEPEYISGYRIKDITFTDNFTGWGVGYDTLNKGVILKTVDGGITWEEKLNDTQPLNSIFFINDEKGWVARNNGLIWKTTDGGETWEYQYSGINAPLNSIFFVDENVGWVVGSGAAIGLTVDGGNTWQDRSLDFYHNLIDVWFTDTENGWIVGEFGVLQTSNAGNTWEVKHKGQVLDAIYFVDPMNGWMAGSGGVILKTIDGGINWEYQQSGTNKYLYDISFTDLDNGWAVGADGTILYTDNGGVVWTPEPPAQTTKPQLKNFPNPFTATTTIEFSLPQNTAVEITVYNQVGQRVALLEKGNHQKGNHRLVFNGNRLPIGIYYCVLKTENKIKTTKMIKLK